tara:strand:- start:265 stop:552 length:288 start_codon:yes stop_codon:yes gene_type:complete
MPNNLEDTMKPTTEQIRSILDANHGRQVSVKFTKKNGELRKLTFRPDDFLPTKGIGTKSPEDVFTVVDAELRQWRAFKAEQVISIVVNNCTHEFN